jgi:hypothetical protein
VTVPQRSRNGTPKTDGRENGMTRTKLTIAALVIGTVATVHAKDHVEQNF